MSGQAEVVAHWVADPHGDRLGQPLDLALAHMVSCVPSMVAICAIDSALHLGLVTLDEIEVHLSRRHRRLLLSCDGSAESGVETMFRLRARRAGFVLRTQVEMPAGRVDFVIGERLLIEVDGSAHHSGHADFVRDRERDALHKALGYVVVRFTYGQVVHRWHEVESVLTLIVGRGEHLWPPRIRRSGRRAG